MRDISRIQTRYCSGVHLKAQAIPSISKPTGVHCYGSESAIKMEAGDLKGKRQNNCLIDIASHRDVTLIA